ncbi:MAG: hypothetical protein ABEJ99_01130 [Candidatus Nanohaloarchaea archaeon]
MDDSNYWADKVDEDGLYEVRIENSHRGGNADFGQPTSEMKEIDIYVRDDDHDFTAYVLETGYFPAQIERTEEKNQNVVSSLLGSDPETETAREPIWAAVRDRDIFDSDSSQAVSLTSIPIDVRETDARDRKGGTAKYERIDIALPSWINARNFGDYLESEYGENGNLNEFGRALDDHVDYNLDAMIDQGVNLAPDGVESSFQSRDLLENGDKGRKLRASTTEMMGDYDNSEITEPSMIRQLEEWAYSGL